MGGVFGRLKAGDPAACNALIGHACERLRRRYWLSAQLRLKAVLRGKEPAY